MKASIINIVKNRKYEIEYILVSKKQFHDDVEAWNKFRFNPPMMEVNLYKDDGTFIERTITYASPEVVNFYTGYDIFYSEMLESYSIVGKSTVLLCEWTEGKYPYIKVDRNEYIKMKKCKYLKITKILDFWEEFFHHNGMINF